MDYSVQYKPIGLCGTLSIRDKILTCQLQLSCILIYNIWYKCNGESVPFINYCTYVIHRRFQSLMLGNKFQWHWIKSINSVRPTGMNSIHREAACKQYFETVSQSLPQKAFLTTYQLKRVLVYTSEHLSLNKNVCHILYFFFKFFFIGLIFYLSGLNSEC